MNGQPGFLTFAWWNLHNFAHYDAARCSNPRWPKRQADYEAKRDRILELEGNFRWMISRPESRLVVLVTFFQQTGPSSRSTPAGSG